jgi:hypothetical protein
MFRNLEAPLRPWLLAKFATCAAFSMIISSNKLMPHKRARNPCLAGHPLGYRSRKTNGQNLGSPQTNRGEAAIIANPSSVTRSRAWMTSRLPVLQTMFERLGSSYKHAIHVPRRGASFLMNLRQRESFWVATTFAMKLTDLL